MELSYNIKITTSAGSIYASNIDMNRCFKDVGIEPSYVTGIGSYYGNIDVSKVKNDRIAVTGSGGFIGYDSSGLPLVEVKNQLIFDLTPPSNMMSIQQTAVQVVTKNLITNKTAKYCPQSQHTIGDSKGVIEISNLEKEKFIDASYANPLMEKLKEDNNEEKTHEKK